MLISLGFFVLLFLPLLSYGEHSPFVCPERCICSANEHVNCGNRGFSSFPKDIPPTARVLDLRHNSLTRLSPSNLRGLDHLETLFLGGNQLRHLDENVLDAVPQLKRLYLGRNQLRNVPQLTSRAFSHLLVFDAHGNQLTHVNNDAFRGLVSLERVHLGHNFLQHLSLKRLFEQNYRLKAVHLAQNPWNCDCRIKDTTVFLRTHSEIEGDSRAKCQNPPELRDVPVRDVEPTTARCFEGIPVESPNGIVLNCDFDAAARLTHWIYDGAPLDASLNGAYEILDNGSLLLRQADVNVHRFECAVDYAVGVTRPIRQLAPRNPLRPPPRSSRTRRAIGATAEGATVKLNCEVQGQPPPRNPNDDTQLIIYPFLEHDVGTYSCDAFNQHGRIQTSARLGIIKSAPPVITEGPKPQKVRPGHCGHVPSDYVDSKIDNSLLKTIVSEATDNIERAVAKTKDDLRGSVQDPGQLMRHFHFAIKRPVELTKAREIYEEAFGSSPPDIPTNVSYESVLSVTHIQTLMELSGCMNGQFTDACTDICFHSKYRSYTGQCNNWEHPTWGVSQMPFRRLLPPMYENGFNTPVGWEPNRKYYGHPKPNPRTVSTALIPLGERERPLAAPALARQTYAGGAICNRTCENVAPCFNIPLPEDDPRRKTEKFPCIEVERSAAICGSGETSPIFRQVTFREQTNIITSFIDASNVYGSTEVDALDLRDLFGDHGLLRFDIVAPQPEAVHALREGLRNGVPPLDEDFKPISSGPLPLQEAFFAPERLLSQGGIDPLLRGLFAKPLKKPMTGQLLTKPLVDKLFYRSENVSMDLAAINIQRGRDHGLQGYLEYRRFCNLTVPETWEELMVDVGNPEVLRKVKSFYGHPGNLDLYENPGMFTPLQLQQIRKDLVGQSHLQQRRLDRERSGRRFQLKFWMSCCDETCAAREPTGQAAQRRRRRSHHLWAAAHPAETQQNCDHGGTTKMDGSHWQLDECTTCKCKRGKVWCSTGKHCEK
ncbi:Leucine-rich repeat and Immunoglobulin I-set and heme peroxidase domain containing protein [Aphelenchoides fujianensis]|nr:Leucine-rich repeat and Immunoglobulin I-set and heme peroxidase domain containing protein [Aphelenchoides fujianensis]